MNERKSWSLLKAVLVASSLIVILFVAPIVIGVVAGYLSYTSEPKTLEIVRVVTVPKASAAPPARSAP